MCCIWLAKNDLDNEVRTLQRLGRIPYCLIINLVSSRKQPWAEECGANFSAVESRPEIIDSLDAGADLGGGGGGAPGVRAPPPLSDATTTH